MTEYKSYEEMLIEYKQLYPEIFSGNYVFGTSNNMIQVMSKLPNTKTDEDVDIKLPYYNADVLKFEFRFNRFKPEKKEYDFDWKSKNIKHLPNGDIHLINDYATYFADLEQTFYFDISRSNGDYTGLLKIWNRGKKELTCVITFENGKPIRHQNKKIGDNYEKENKIINCVEISSDLQIEL
jgi:hypothetical protein